MSASPRVGVVVLNHDGGELTLDCLRSVLVTEWPAERLDIVLVDNASTDGIVARVRTEMPSIEIIESAVNTGFAGGCNLGFASLAHRVDHIALVNNDATVDPGWLEPLVAALDADPQVGAAGSKILFAGTFRELRISAPTRRRGFGDGRDLGVRLSGARVDRRDVWSRAQLVSGFWGPERLGQWSTDEAVIRLPDAGDVAELELSSLRPITVTVSSGAETRSLEVDAEARWLHVPFAGDPATIVNNVGTVLTPDGYGADRGYLEPDDGRFDEPQDVFAWCGAAVLLRGSYLDDVGLFDEALFLYYEDLELSWRGQERGWRYRYVPESRVFHVHAASSVEGSALKEHYNERNRLLVLARHRGTADVARAALRHLAVTASYARRDIVSPVLRGEAPDGRAVGRRLRALGGFLRRAPGTRRHSRP
jgi:GT2 family glycosyltransferase